MKDFEFIDYYNEYKELLTENQSDIFSLYFLYDLSLSEIAEMKETTRQSVSDNINKTKKILKKYEDKLHLARKKALILKEIEGIPEESRKKIKEILGERDG